MHSANQIQQKSEPERLWSQARAYVSKKTASWPREEVLLALDNDDVRDAAQQIDAALLAEDATACATACKAWWKAILAHTPQEETIR